MKSIAIAGAGPVGLLGALLLCKDGNKVTVFEQASREKLFMDQGSGFTLSPSSCYILETLGLYESLKMKTRGYDTLELYTSEGEAISKENISINVKSDLGEYEMIPISRSLFQNFVMNHLKKYEDEGSFVLKSSSSVLDFVEKENKVQVIYELKVENETNSEDFDVLLGCDGVYSKVRKSMMKKLCIEDNLNYTGITAWWNKFHYAKALTSDDHKKRNFAELVVNHFKKASRTQVMLPTPKMPLSFFATQINENLMNPDETTLSIVIFAEREEPTISERDLTKRGGTSGRGAKEEILKLLCDEKGNPKVSEALKEENIVFKALEAMEEEDFVMCGLYDRNNLKVPFSSGRVCILGDAAHPQTPFLGQGLNMGITDAYVVALNLRKFSTVQEALLRYDSEERKKSGQAIVDGARIRGQICQYKTTVSSWIRKQAFKILGGRSIVHNLIDKDQSNRNAILEAERDD